MKRILLFIVLSATALVSCAKKEFVVVDKNDEAISFEAYTGREVTKAQVTDITTANLSAFKVACYLSGSGNKYFKQDESATFSDSYWRTETSYFWPADGTSKLDFYAYSGTGAGTVSVTDAGVATLTYTMIDAATEDFIVACAEDKEKPESSSAQTLTFSHALAKISSLTVKSAEGASRDEHYKFTVTDVKLSQAVKTGTYCFNTPGWTPGSEKKDFAFDNKSFSFAGNVSHTLQTSSKNDQLALIPQTVTMSITYSVEYSGDGTHFTTIMTSATKTAPIPIDMGKSYAITLELPNDASPILFTVDSVTDWTGSTVVRYMDGFDDLRDAFAAATSSEIKLSGDFSGKCVKPIEISSPITIKISNPANDFKINNTGSTPLFKLTGEGTLTINNASCYFDSSLSSMFGSDPGVKFIIMRGNFLKSSWEQSVVNNHLIPPATDVSSIKTTDDLYWIVERTQNPS